MKHPWITVAPWLSPEEVAIIEMQSLLTVNVANDRHVVRRGAWYGVEL